MGDGLVEEIVAEDSFAVAIVAGEALPDSDEVGLLLGAVVEPGVAVAVVDVGAGLAARCDMEVEDDIEVFLAGPLDDVVEEREALGVVCLEEFVVEGNADGVEAGFAKEVDVLAGDVDSGGTDARRERPRCWGRCELGDEGLDLGGGLRGPPSKFHM